MALNAASLKAAMFADVKAKLEPLFADPESPPSLDDTWGAICEAIATQVVDHIVANLEVKGVTVDMATALIAVFGAGVPAPPDGGAALQVAWLAGSTGKVGLQNDDGTGHVA